jgi:hypothetical protein
MAGAAPLLVALCAAVIGACAQPQASGLPAAPETQAPPAVSSAAPAQQRPVGPQVSAVSEADLGRTWRPGCPVTPEDLRRVELDFLGFDGRMHRGSLVVHRDLTEEVAAVFAELLELRYPIERMQTVEVYPGAEDELSMRDNNTSAFNCRPLPGGTGWSRHAYGRAVDLNPLINPYIDAAGNLEPATAGDYLDRRRDDPGILRADSPAVRVFTDRGWSWGGAWRTPVDYQHFEFD